MSIPKAPIPRAGKYPAPPKKLEKELHQYLEKLRQQLANDHTLTSNFITQQSGQGLAADLPPPGSRGRLYFATDTLTLYYDTGALWHHVIFSF